MVASRAALWADMSVASKAAWRGGAMVVLMVALSDEQMVPLMVELKAYSTAGQMDDLMIEHLVCWMAVLWVDGTAAMTVDSSAWKKDILMEQSLVDRMVASMVALMALQWAEYWSVSSDYLTVV